MSKKRPSARGKRRHVSAGDGLLIKAQAGYWSCRLFKNTFTRGGRRFTVDKWCVKIQHHGRRRTFSLSAVTRREASEEARKLYLTLVKEGWEMLENDRVALRSRADLKAPLEEHRSNKLSADYWKQALIFRSGATSTHAPGKTAWSAWLDHGGAGYYFPLHSESADRAGVEALRIYQKVRTRGWAAVFKLHPREVTVAFHWTDNPLAWTYTTFRTLLRRQTAGATVAPVWQVVVVETDAGLRQAIEFYINLHPGFACLATFGSVESALAWMRIRHPDLVLVNQNLSDFAGAKVLSDLQKASSGTLGMLFSVYADSGQLFKCSPGGALGYLFKRTPPERMLEPLLNGGPPRSPSPQYLSAVARECFQRVLTRLELKSSSSKLATLTPRESQILDYLSKGFLDKEIAGAVGISAWTVHGHLKNIFEKLQVHNRLEAVLKYLNK